MSADKPGALCYQLPDGTWDDQAIHEELLGESLDIDPAIQAMIDRTNVSDEYNPNQPRVPKGSGDPSGQWAGRLEEPTPGSLARERARAEREEEAGREAYEARYAELHAKEKKRVAALAAFSESRAPGESDKEFAKRVIDKRDPPDRLPQDFEANFNMKPDTQIVPIDKIISSKSAEETITSAPNAAKRMAAAANGELSRRDPISVRPLQGSDAYKVLDGNSTYAAAKHYGWTHLPVQVLLKDSAHVIFDGTEDMDYILQFMREHDVPITRDAYIALNWPDLRDNEWDSELEDELPEFLQDWSLFEGVDGELVYRPTMLDYNREHLPAGSPGSKGGEFAPKGIGTHFITRTAKLSEFGKTVKEERGQLTHEDIDKDLSRNTNTKPKQPTNDFDELYQRSFADEAEFIDNVNNVAFATSGEARFGTGEGTSTLKMKSTAAAKIAREYGGDTSRLVDVVRGTVAYDTIENARYGAEAFMRASGDRVVRAKDRIVNPDASGYRDILVSYRTESGTISEIQFNAVSMLRAKDGGGHKIYEAMNRQGPLDPDAGRRLRRESQMLYDKHYEIAGNGTYGKRR